MITGDQGCTPVDSVESSVAVMVNSAVSDNYTVRDALAEYNEAALDAIIAELRQMLSFPTFEAIDWRNLSKEQLKQRIPSKMFIKLKYLANGDFDKIKARLVAGGHRQDRSLYSEEQTSSPTAGTSSVFVVAGLAAREKRKVRVIDFIAAFLKAHIIQEINMYLDVIISSLLCVMKPEWVELLDHKGRLTVKLLRALYGCVESGKLWYDTLSEFLESMGYVRNPHDICVFNKWNEDVQLQSTIIIHVDDLMLTCADDGPLDEIAGQLRARFGEITEHTGLLHNYLGMQFDFSEVGRVNITMSGYVDKMLIKYGISESMVEKYPTNDNLFKRDDNSPALDDYHRIEFHSSVYTVAYLAQRIKPECLPIVSELSSHVRCPTEEDWEKLTHLLRYVNGTRHIGMCIEIPSGPICVNASIDSSHGCHANMRGQGAGVLSLSRDGTAGTIHCESYKLALNTKSTAETELVTMSDYASQALHVASLLTEQGYPGVTTVIEQDNESTIALIRKGRSTAKATRHIAIRYFWLHDRLQQCEFELVHVAGTKIRSDLLTKDIRGAQFLKTRKVLNNWA